MEPAGIAVLIGTGGAVAAYTVLHWRLHVRDQRRVRVTACPGGTPHLWQGGYQWPPKRGPVEEECDLCLARRVVDYGEGDGAPRVLRYLPPARG